MIWIIMMILLIMIASSIYSQMLKCYFDGGDCYDADADDHDDNDDEEDDDYSDEDEGYDDHRT